MCSRILCHGPRGRSRLRSRRSISRADARAKSQFDDVSQRDDMCLLFARFYQLVGRPEKARDEMSKIIARCLQALSEGEHSRNADLYRWIGHACAVCDDDANAMAASVFATAPPGPEVVECHCSHCGQLIPRRRRRGGARTVPSEFDLTGPVFRRSKTKTRR